MTDSTPATINDEQDNAVTSPAAPDCLPAGLEVPAVCEEELVAASEVLEHTEDWDTRDAARAVLAAAVWVRAHPDQAEEAPARALAAGGPDRRGAWWSLAADAAITAVVVWAVVTGRLTALLDSIRWPHVAWLFAGAIALALLTGAAEDIHRCYRAARRAHPPRLSAPGTTRRADTTTREGA